MKTYFSTLKHLITLVFLTLLISCENNPLDIDVKEVKVDLAVNRFDQDLFQYTNGINPGNVTELNNKYGLFFQDFTQSVINIGSIKNPTINQRLNAFATDTYINEVKTDVANVYSDFSEFENELNEAFKHYKYYFN